MDVYPLQEPLVDAVIRFANIKLNHPNAIVEVFDDTWPMELLPRLRVCRAAQREARAWLMTLADGNGDLEAVISATLGRRKNMERVDSGIRFAGDPGYRIVKDEPGGKARHEITVKWRVSEASLRSICGFAVTTIYQAGLQDRVGLCERDGCDNLFIDRVSRGTRRRHCLGDECERARNAARQDAWRKRHAKRRSRKA